MNRLLRPLRPLLIGIGLMLPASAFAQYYGGAAVTSILVDVTESLFPIVLTVGILTTVVIGITLVSTSEDSQLAKAKGSIIALIAGAFLIKLTPNMVDLFFNQQVLSSGGTGIINNALNVTLEAVGVAQWFETLAITAAVFTIILAGFRAIASFGSEAANSAVRRSVLHGIAGILVLVLIGVMRLVIFRDRQPNALIQAIFARVDIVLGLIALIMVAIIIYAGVLMVVSVANEGNNEKAKGLILRAVIGLILIILSMVLIQIVIGIFS